MSRRAILEETVRIAGLAWPVVLTSLNWTLLGVTDIWFVGAAGAREVAVFGANRALTLVALVGAISWLSGVLVFAARADGAADGAAARATWRAGVVLALLLGGFGAATIALLAPMLLGAIGVAAPIVGDAARVVRVMALCFPVQLVSVASAFFLEGMSRPRRVAAVNLAVLPLNAGLAWAWTTGQLGFPAWGALGAAAATACASLIGAAGMVAAAWRVGRGRGLREPSRRTIRAALREATALARFGAAPAFASALELGGFAILIALSTELGDTSAHAFQIVFAVHNVTFSLALGLGSAAGVRVGNAVGAGEHGAAAPRALIAAALAAAATGSLAILIAVSRDTIVGAFPATAEVHALAAAMLFAWVPFIVFDAVQVVLVYALRSLGDQVAAGVNGVAAFFLVSGGAGLALVHAGVGPFALVYASGGGMVAAALLNAVRLAVVSARDRPKSLAPAPSR